MARRLGRYWKTLHRLAYVIPVLGVLHYLWLVKADTLMPLLYGCLLAMLLALRTPAAQAIRGRVSRRGVDLRGGRGQVQDAS
jgi:sulfoxide reductase heme-binding subunit YedZ